ncbi:MAG: sugar ABC transporter substrate-binding protein [Armatimonadota bacterium]|jgi:multiple sugar transport system substrate-binding protein
MRRSVLLPATTAAAIAAILPGCTLERVQPEGEPRVTLVFGIAGDPVEQATYGKLAAAFEERNPDIEVTLRHVPTRFEDKMQTEMAGGTAPDVMFFQDEYFPMFAAKNAFLDLTPYIEEDNMDLSDFFEQGIVEFSYQGRLHGFPRDWGANVIFYNKDLFDQAGVPHPDEDWTWDDFLDAATRLTRDNDADGRVDQYGFVISTTVHYGLPWVWAAGGEVLNEDRTECTIFSPESVAGLQVYVDYMLKHKVAPSPMQTETLDVTAMFMTGRLAMYNGGPFAVPQYRTIEDFEWDVAFLPKGPRGRVTRYYGDGYVAWRETEHPREAWEFLKFLTSEYCERLYAEDARGIPSRKSVAYSEDFIRPDTPWDERIFVDSAKYAHLQPITTRYPEMDVAWREPYERILLGELTVAEALEIMDHQLDELLAEAG